LLLRSTFRIFDFVLDTSVSAEASASLIMHSTFRIFGFTLVRMLCLGKMLPAFASALGFPYF